MLANLVVESARVMASRVLGAAKAVLVNLEGIVGTSSTDEPFFSGPVVWRPRPPVADGDGTGLNPAGECEVLCIKNEDGLQPVAARDLRVNARTNPAEGEVLLAGYDGGFLSIKPADNGLGSQVVLLAPRLNAGGSIVSSHGLTMDPGAGNSVALVHRSGHGLVLTTGGDAVLKNASGNVYAQANGSGLTLNGNTQVVGGMVVSPGTPTPQAVMLSTAMLSWVSQVNAALAVLAGAAGSDNVPAITAPTAVPIASSKLSAAP